MPAACVVHTVFTPCLPCCVCAPAVPRSACSSQTMASPGTHSKPQHAHQRRGLLCVLQDRVRGECHGGILEGKPSASSIAAGSKWPAQLPRPSVTAHGRPHARMTARICRTGNLKQRPRQKAARTPKNKNQKGHLQGLQERRPKRTTSQNKAPNA